MIIIKVYKNLLDKRHWIVMKKIKLVIILMIAYKKVDKIVAHNKDNKN